MIASMQLARGKWGAPLSFYFRKNALIVSIYELNFSFKVQFIEYLGENIS